MWADALTKFGNAAGAVVVFVAVLLLIFFAAGRASGRVSKPLAVTIFLGPALLLLAVGLVVPAIRTITLSFYNDDSSKFLGGSNYTWAFTSSGEQQILLNTLLWIIVAPVVTTVLGLVLALLVDRLKHQGLYKAFLFMPMAISFVGASIIWKFVYNYRDPSQPQIGLLSQICLWLGFRNPPN